MKQKTKIKKNLEKITTNSYYSDNERTLRKIGTNIFFYCGFFLSGFILIIVAAILLHKGYSYSGSEDFKNYATASSALVLSNASTSLFVVGALFIFFPIIINLYVIDKIEKVEILKNNVSKNVYYLLVMGIIFQITTFIGMILLYKELKRIYIESLYKEVNEYSSKKDK
ncbi:MAG: hypothetical protein K2I76_02155 [Malacoplasma sp.]|nr:hypothetical protein [Malacoplasma sp.]MDE6082331.1 hypothetical protein [Malacoplasma sp.]